MNAQDTCDANQMIRVLHDINNHRISLTAEVATLLEEELLNTEKTIIEKLYRLYDC